MDPDTTNLLSKDLTSKISKQQWRRNAKHNKGIRNLKFLREPTSLTSFHDNPTKLIHKEMSTRIVGTISYSSKMSDFFMILPFDHVLAHTWNDIEGIYSWCHWHQIHHFRENYNNTKYKYVPKHERKLHGQRPTKTVWHLLLKKTVGAHRWTQAYNHGVTVERPQARQRGKQLANQRPR